MVLNEEELTFGCGEGGRLVGCTFCFNAAHTQCCGLGDKRTHAPRGDWACPACVDHARAIPNIKTKWFCFMSVGSDKIACRERSCHCLHCLAAGNRVHLLPKTGLSHIVTLIQKHTLTHSYALTGPKACLNYDTCGPWRVYTVIPNDKEWDRLIAFLNAEGRNETKRWNDYCGCYEERFD